MRSLPFKSCKFTVFSSVPLCHTFRRVTDEGFHCRNHGLAYLLTSLWMFYFLLKHLNLGFKNMPTFKIYFVVLFIMQTCPYNEYPITLHFCILKRELTQVYIPPFFAHTLNIELPGGGTNLRLDLCYWTCLLWWNNEEGSWLMSFLKWI